MATYYAIGSGNWTWSSANTANWSLSSGGATAGVAPTATDNVIFDSHSTTGTVAWTSGVCLSLSCIAGTGNFAGTLGSNNNAHSIPGSFDLAPTSSMTFNGTGTITFTSTTSGNTITSGGNSLPAYTFNGIGGVWTMQDTHTFASGKIITLTKGDLECNGQTVNVDQVSGSNSNNRTLTITNSTINLTGTGTVWTLSTISGLTFNSTGSIINITDTSATTKTLNMGVLTYNNVNITGGTNLGLVSLNNGFTVAGTLSNTPGNPINLTFSTTTPVATLSITGSATTQSSIGSNTPGTLRTITLTNPATVTYTTFQDVAFTTSYVTATTGGINNGNNRGIIFPTGPYCLQVTGNSSGSSGTTLNASYVHTVTNGSLMIVGITLASGTVSSVTDAKGNTYTQIATINNGGTGNTYLYYTYNAVGGTTDSTSVHLSGTGLVVSFVLREYGGMPSSNPLDQSGTATNTTGNISVSTTGSTTQANELVFALGSSFTSTDTLSVGTGYSNFAAQIGQVTAQSVAEELLSSGATGVQTATFGNSVTSTWSGIIATFNLSVSVHLLSSLGAGT